ncbi:hypothetical protein [Planococcus wigleyi]|uniref:Uncharacterized protein n=1 Tax=Planococcus wigleyi TaxID=2762216 RepID=A0ABR8WIB6_9BACL|nr:hypothetical protein [Planococcus wigleyi]MBD8016810.1 hypothetical protein [Planococcus wigleyi]
MKEILTYRGVYVIVGAIFAFLITQSSLTDRTQRWVLVAYIVGGIIVTELLRKKARKKQEEASTQKENAHP